MKITFYLISICTRYCIKYYKLRTLSQLLSWLIVKDLLEGNGNPLHYSCLVEFHEQRSQAGYSLRNHKELDTTE